MTKFHKIEMMLDNDFTLNVFTEEFIEEFEFNFDPLLPMKKLRKTFR